MLTVEQAVTIVHRHGLELRDAVSLRVLTDDEEAAERLAVLFTKGNAQPDREGVPA